MTYQFMVLLSYSIVPAAIVSIFKFRRDNSTFFPVMAYLILGLVNEIISTVIISRGESNAVNSNIFMLCESLLILYQFRLWRLFDEFMYLFRIGFWAFIAGWIIQNHSYTHLHNFLPFFKCATSICILLMSVINIIKLVLNYNGQLLKSSEFLFCVAFCMYFSISILVELVLYYSNDRGVDLRDAIFKAGSIINALSNIICLIALLWMPVKSRYIMQ